MGPDAGRIAHTGRRKSFHFPQKGRRGTEPADARTPGQTQMPGMQVGPPDGAIYDWRNGGFGRRTTVHPRNLAAVRREVAPGAVGSALGPAVDKVWDFIRSQSGLWADGHNVFLYHHPIQPGAPILCDFGVEITRTFEPADEVYATETPGGEAAVAVYRGPYSGLGEAYEAIDGWMWRTAESLPGTRGRSTEIRRRTQPIPRRRSSTC
jgi:effector-binding domain-containing protein